MRARCAPRRAPWTPSRARRLSVQWVSHIDLKAATVPMPIISLLTNKIAGAALAALSREAARLGRESRDGDDAWIRRIERSSALYESIGALFTKYFDLYGADERQTGGPDGDAAA